MESISKDDWVCPDTANAGKHSNSNGSVEKVAKKGKRMYFHLVDRRPITPKHTLSTCIGRVMMAMSFEQLFSGLQACCPTFPVSAAAAGAGDITEWFFRLRLKPEKLRDDDFFKDVTFMIRRCHETHGEKGQEAEEKGRNVLAGLRDAILTPGCAAAATEAEERQVIDPDNDIVILFVYTLHLRYFLTPIAYHHSSYRRSGACTITLRTRGWC